MTFVFEIDRLFNSRPAFLKTSIMYRFCWLWFGITILRDYTFVELALNKHTWKLDGKKYDDFEKVRNAYFRKKGQWI